MSEQKRTGEADPWLVELVSGPFCGYFFAGYTRACPDGFHAYMKIFDKRPPSVWESSARAKVASFSPDSYHIALALAEARAIHWVKLLVGAPTTEPAVS